MEKPRFASAIEMETYFSEMRALFSAQKAEEEKAAARKAAAEYAAASLTSSADALILRVAELRNRAAEILAPFAAPAPRRSSRSVSSSSSSSSSADHVKLARTRARSTWYNARLRHVIPAETEFDTWYTDEKRTEFEARASAFLAAQSAPAPVPTFA